MMRVKIERVYNEERDFQCTYHESDFDDRRRSLKYVEGVMK